MEKHRIGAFSLIELSIVLIIVGLLIGAVTAGQALVNNARLKKVESDALTLISAMKNFQDKYQYLPGDVPNATDIWSASGDCSTNIAPGNATCNGNGDGQIGGISKAHIGPTWTTYFSNDEGFHGLKQLSNAKMISNLSNTVTGAVSEVTEAVPDSGLKGGVFAPIYIGSVKDSGAGTAELFFDGDYGNVLMYGTDVSPNAFPIISAKQMLLFDKKFDDGQASFGSIRPLKSGGGHGNNEYNQK